VKFASGEKGRKRGRRAPDRGWEGGKPTREGASSDQYLKGGGHSRMCGNSASSRSIIPSVTKSKAMG